MYDIIIIGGGAAGLTAAIYAGRGGASTLVLAGADLGGQAVQTELIENYSGVPSADGYTLMETMRKQAESVGVEIKREAVTLVECGSVKRVSVEGGKEYTAKTLIIATGASHKHLGLEGEEAPASGVSYCATCDGGFYRKKSVAVVGGGDSALTEAIYLSKLCSEVYLIHRRKEYRAAKVLVDRAKGIKNIVHVLDSKVTALVGNPLEAIEVEGEGGKSVIPVSGLFVAIGTVPNSELVKDKLECDGGGYIITDGKMKTSLEGIFAAGDVRNGALKQIITACADGAVAAAAALEHIG